MKKKLFYLALLFNGIAGAQNLIIPDANLKQWLLNASTTNGTAMNATNVSVVIDVNHDGEIQVAETANIWSLYISGSTITNLSGVEGFTALRNATIGGVGATGINLSSNLNLQGIYISDCPNLTSINVSNLPNLTIFRAMFDSALQTVNMSNSSNINTITITETNVSLLDLSTLPNITYLNLDNNNLQELDISQNPLVQQFYCANNDLHSLNMKNGTVISQFSVDGNVNLPYICVDELEMSVVESAANGPNMNTFVSSYCSFTPGGDYNTITGTLTFDANNNGCDSNDIFQPNIRVNIIGNGNSGANFTDTNGDYTFYTQTGSFAIIPAVENPAWFNFSPPSAIIPFSENDTIVTQDFCISANGIHPDVELVIAPIVPARPGFDAVYKIVFKNKGNQTVSGNVVVAYDDSVLDFVSADGSVTNSNGFLSHVYTNLLPFEDRSFYVTMHVSAPPTVNIDDQLIFNGSVNPIEGDENPTDNVFQYHQTVVGSYDPNNITCAEGNTVSPSQIGNYLHYVINFENTGTAAAENIVIRDSIDTNQFDVNSLQILNSSSPMTARVTGNIVEFIFQNINLHSGGHGNILIKIKTKNTLTEGDMVSKKADIYFDYNLPVETLPENTIFQALNNPDINHDASIKIYPNPTKANVNINCDNNIRSIQLYDAQGRLLQTNVINENQATIDISSKSGGIYFLKITSDKGIGVQKIIKE